VLEPRSKSNWQGDRPKKTKRRVLEDHAKRMCCNEKRKARERKKDTCGGQVLLSNRMADNVRKKGISEGAGGSTEGKLKSKKLKGGGRRTLSIEETSGCKGMLNRR